MYLNLYPQNEIPGTPLHPRSLLFVCMVQWLVLIKLWLVTDRQMERQMDPGP